MASPYEIERKSFMVHLKHSSAIGIEVAEEVKTTPLLSLKVKHAVEKTDNSSEESSQSSDGLIQFESTTVPEVQITEDVQDESIKDDSANDNGEMINQDAEAADETDEAASQMDQMSIEGSAFPQYSLLGFHVGDHAHIGRDEPILLNTRAPNSVFICGSQHSGKSYTLSCMLESALLSTPQFGPPSHPLAGVVFHYDVDASGSVAEAASLCSAGIKVNVLVSRSNFATLRDAYMRLPGAEENLRVERMLLKDSHLNINRMQRLMAVSEGENGVPLYMEILTNILREMAIAGNQFSWNIFEWKIKEAGLDTKQGGMLNLRMQLLKSFMENFAGRHERSKGMSIFAPQPGTLTFVDLSDPLVDAASACVLFDICLGIMKQNRPQNGMVVALDEAHKYLNRSASAANFTESLLTTIREQRHNATRVIIATQEPTLSEKLLDLSSVSIVHRFTSPAWFESIKGHLGAASSLIATTEQQRGMLDRIVNLNTGESLVFSPSSYVCHDGEQIKKLGTEVLMMKTRLRITMDAGRSKMAGD